MKSAKKNGDKNIYIYTYIQGTSTPTIFIHIQYQSRRGHHRQRCEQTVERREEKNERVSMHSPIHNKRNIKKRLSFDDDGSVG
jgi:hypothetical protein